MLKRRGIKHNVLNAKYHQQEAEIVSPAGQHAAVTIATNMAGRGTDIKLGAGVTDLGGLHIIGTERHESRRIDRQLRGRAGRQGDPGPSRFYLSLEDDLMRLFGSERISGLMERMGVEEGEVIEHPLVTGAISRAQKRVEAHNFDIRKHLLEYDDVMNQQREVIYGLRNGRCSSTDMSETVLETARRGGAHAGREEHRRAGRAPRRVESQGPVGRAVVRADDARFDRRSRGRALRANWRRRRWRWASARIAHARSEFSSADDARTRTLALSWRDRRTLAGSFVRARSSQGRHRAAGLRAARPLDRVQARGVRPVRVAAGRVA